jgi:hypothetical protein
VKIFTKRNAIVGFMVLKMRERRRARRGSRKALKVAGFAALALVSAGILAGLVAVALRRSRGRGELSGEAQRLEGFASVDDELGLGLPEPGFAA